MDDKKVQYEIAECVAAMDMMRQLICGMYGELNEREKQHNDAVQAFGECEQKLQGLVDKLPNDALTLNGIREAAASVKTLADKIPRVVKNEIDLAGHAIASVFMEANVDHLADIKNAASDAVDAAHAYKHAAVSLKWSVVGAAISTNVICISVALVALWYWLPSYQEIQTMRVERDQLSATVSKLDRAGGRAMISECGGRICAVVDGTSLSEPWRDPKTNEIAVILKGY